ncbi:MAG: hypothetical protein PHW74_03595 [Desulfobacca sp.]|nr:hypothetical protein [Desulfobacca sp.]
MSDLLNQVTGLAGEDELLDMVIWEPPNSRRVSLWTGIDGQMAVLVHLSPETSTRWREIFTQFGTFGAPGGPGGT